MYAVVLAVIAILLILVIALDYQRRSSQAVYRMAEARMYVELAALDHVGETLTNKELHPGQSWPSVSLPVSMDEAENESEVKFDQVIEMTNWTKATFPRTGYYPEVGQTADSLGQQVESPGSEDNGVKAYPGQYRAILTPESNTASLEVGPTKYRMSLLEAFPFAAYAPNGEVTINGEALSWTNPTEAEIDFDHPTLDFYSGLPFRVGAKRNITVKEMPYGEAYSLEQKPQVRGGGIGYQGYLPYQGYETELRNAIMGNTSGLLGGVAGQLSGFAYNKTDVCFGTLNVENIIKALFSSGVTFDNFLTYEQSTRFWFFLIPGFKSRGPAIDITLHAPLRPDGTDYNEANSDSEPLSPEAQEATDYLEEVNQVLQDMLATPAKPGDPPGVQPTDMGKWTQMMNDFAEAEQLMDQAKDKRKEKSKDKTDAENNAIDREADRIERDAQRKATQHGFDDVDDMDDWLNQNRLPRPSGIGSGIKHGANLDYDNIANILGDAMEDLNEAKKDANADDSADPTEEYDPGPDRAKQKELKTKDKIDKNGWKGTNLWYVLAKIAKVIVRLVKDIGTAFFNHVFVEVLGIPLPNPLNIPSFFIGDGVYEDQDVQGQPYSFKPANGTPDLVDLVLRTLQVALVQEVTLIYLGKDDGCGPSVPVRITRDGALQDMQAGNPGAEQGFSIHNTFTVPAGRSFRIESPSYGMTIGADLWLQRGSVMVVQGDLTLEDPDAGRTRPRGKLIMEPGSTLVVNGDFTAAGDPLMGSVLLTRRPSHTEPITSAILCSGTVNIPHGTRSGLTLPQMVELVSPDIAEVVQDFFDDIPPNIAKFWGPFHKRYPFFASNGATLTFYFPVVVPNPLSSMLNKNINVRLFRLLSPLMAGSLNMTLGENFYLCSDWWMFGEDRVPALPKLLPGPAEAAVAVAAEEAVSLIGAGGSSLEDIKDENFFIGHIQEVVTGEIDTMLNKAENFVQPDSLANFVTDVGQGALANYFTAENVTALVVEFLQKAALAALDPSGAAAIALDAVLPDVEPDSFLEIMQESAITELTEYGFPLDGKDYLGGVLQDCLDPYTTIAESLKSGATDGAKKVAATLLAAETPGVLIYGDTLEIGGLFAAGMFVANGNITMNADYTFGTLASVSGNITANHVYYNPDFSRAAIYQPPETVESPTQTGIAALPKMWQDATGLDFGNSGGDFGKSLNYGAGAEGSGASWREIPGPTKEVYFEAAGGWGH